MYLQSIITITWRGSLHVFARYQSLIFLPRFWWELSQSAFQSTSHLASPLLIQCLIASVKQRCTSLGWFISNSSSFFAGTFSSRPRLCHLSRENPSSVPTLSWFRTFLRWIFNSGSVVQHVQIYSFSCTKDHPSFPWILGGGWLVRLLFLVGITWH